MLKNESRKRLMLGVWLGAAIVIVAGSVVYGAALSTVALLLVLCAVPMGVAMRIGFGAPSPTVAEVLYDVDTSKDGR